jgi:hypothetical protein
LIRDRCRCETPRLPQIKVINAFICVINMRIDKNVFYWEIKADEDIFLFAQLMSRNMHIDYYL